MRRLIEAFAILLTLWTAQPAQADSYIAYSKPENYYGYCYGCNSSGGDDALEECRKGGSACELVLSCGGGWSSVAFADSQDVQATGMVCGMASEFGARAAAWLACMDASHWYCYTAETASGGGTVHDYGDDWHFDVTYLCQGMLQLMDYDVQIDGDAGPRTQTAIRAFQAKMGLEQTGVVDQTLLWQLEMAYGGRALMWQAAMPTDQEKADLADVRFSYSNKQDPIPSFGNELMALSENDRLTALALNLRAEGQDCTLPALSAKPMFDEPDEMWDINCKEADYTVMLWPDGKRFIDRHEHQ